MKPIAGVMGPGEGATEELCELAFELGRQIALQGWVLLTGGRNVGVMDAAIRGAASQNGLTIALLPGADRNEASPHLGIAIPTGMGNARNVINSLASDVVIACGMGAGTASEVAIAIKLQKPVILLEVSSKGCEFFKELGGDRVYVAESVQEAIARMRELFKRITVSGLPQVHPL